MTLGGSIIYTCPKCGKEKSLMALASGNTFGSTLWSDNKMNAPMLPRPSYVQRCCGCGTYFTLEGRFPKSSSVDSMELGDLSFPQMKDALKQMEDEGFSSAEDELNFRIFFVQSYNDEYARKGTAAPKEDKTLFFRNVHALVQNACWKNEDFATALKAEFYREIGEFENASACISRCSKSNDEFVKSYIDNVNRMIEAKSSEVFQIR